jgi:hypothetical protein
MTDDLLSFEMVNQKIWDLEFEIFIPAAASRLVTRQQVDKMIGSGVEVFSCGANVPFSDPEIFFGPTGLDADEKISIIPDFIANCGMARVFAYFMESEAAMDDAAIFNDISITIRKALEKTKKVNPSRLDRAEDLFNFQYFAQFVHKNTSVLQLDFDLRFRVWFHQFAFNDTSIFQVNDVHLYICHRGIFILNGTSRIIDNVLEVFGVDFYNSIL